MNEHEHERYSTIVTVRFGMLMPVAWMGVGIMCGWTEALLFGPLSVFGLIVLGGMLRYLNGERDFIDIDRKYERLRDDHTRAEAAINAVRSHSVANDCSDELVEDIIEHAALTPVPEPNGDDIQPETGYREPAVQHVCRCGKLSHHG